MHLIHSIPSDRAVRDALIKEIKTGHQLYKERERKAELEAREQAKELRTQKEVKGLGRCVAVVPADDYMLLNKRYGRQEVHSKEFLSYFQKKYPELSPHKL